MISQVFLALENYSYVGDTTGFITPMRSVLLEKSHNYSKLPRNQRNGAF
jgi:hypothetical protein